MAEEFIVEITSTDRIRRHRRSDKMPLNLQVVVIRVKGLAPARSRLIEPRVELVPA